MPPKRTKRYDKEREWKAMQQNWKESSLQLKGRLKDHYTKYEETCVVIRTSKAFGTFVYVTGPPTAELLDTNHDAIRRISNLLDDAQRNAPLDEQIEEEAVPVPVEVPVVSEDQLGSVVTPPEQSIETQNEDVQPDDEDVETEEEPEQQKPSRVQPKRGTFRQKAPVVEKAQEGPKRQRRNRTAK